MMKRIFLICFFLAKCFIVFSQNISGEVIYIKKSNFEHLKDNLNTRDSEAQTNAFLEKLKKEIKDVKYILSFSENESNYTKAKSLTNDSDQGVLSKLHLGNFKGEFYFNYGTKEAIHKKEFLGKPMLVESPINRNWVLLKDKKDIIGYECFKAQLKIYYKDLNNTLKESLITAWYAPELNIPFGPEKFNSLPGLILELEDGNSKIVAKEVKPFKNGEKVKLKKPTEGRKITEHELEEEARKMILEKMKRVKN